MNCKQARQQIDEKLQATAEGRSLSADRQTKLDQHLAICPACLADYESLGAQMNDLDELANRRPTGQEKDDMLAAIRSGMDEITVGKRLLRPRVPAWLRRLPWAEGAQFAAACLVIGVVLLLAWQIGQQRYGGQAGLLAWLDGDAVGAEDQGPGDTSASTTATVEAAAAEPASRDVVFGVPFVEATSAEGSNASAGQSGIGDRYEANSGTARVGVIIELLDGTNIDNNAQNSTQLRPSIRILDHEGNGEYDASSMASGAVDPAVIEGVEDLRMYGLNPEAGLQADAGANDLADTLVSAGDSYFRYGSADVGLPGLLTAADAPSNGGNQWNFGERWMDFEDRPVVVGWADSDAGGRPEVLLGLPPAQEEGIENFVFTTDTDYPTGHANDAFTAFASATAAFDAYNTDAVASGREGEDTVNFTMQNNEGFRAITGLLSLDTLSPMEEAADCKNAGELGEVVEVGDLVMAADPTSELASNQYTLDREAKQLSDDFIDLDHFVDKNIMLRTAAPGQSSPATTDASTDAADASTDQSPLDPQARPQRPAITAKIIKTADVSIEVNDYHAAAAKVETLATAAGGFVADSTTEERAGGALAGEIVCRCSPVVFDQLFTALKTIGKVTAEQARAQDVTAQYTDLEARIVSAQMTEQRLQELIQDKSFLDKVSSLLEVERELQRVRETVEKMQGQLRVMANRVGLSTIRVRLFEPARTVPSATLSIEVRELTTAASRLVTVLTDLDGRMESGQSAKQSAGQLEGEYVVEVPLTDFALALSDLAELGRVRERNVKGREFAETKASWAKEVFCRIDLTLREPKQTLPSGEMTLEVNDVQGAYRTIEPLLAQHEATAIYNKSERRDDGSSVANLRIDAPAGQFARLVRVLEEDAVFGRTINKQLTGDLGEVVGGAAGVSCTLKLTLSEPRREIPAGSMVIEVSDFETARQALSALVAEKELTVLASGSQQRTDGSFIGAFRLGVLAADMEDVVRRLERMGVVLQRKIQGIGLGNLSRIQPTTRGVIELTLGEKANINPPNEKAGGTLRTSTREALEGLFKSVGLIIYGLVVLLPWLVIVVVGGWLLRSLWRRLRRKPGAKAG